MVISIRTERGKKSGPIGSIIGGIIFLALGGGILWFWAWPEIQKGRASTDWPTAPGVILSSKLGKSKNSDGDTQYKANVNYEYFVKEERFEGNTVKFGTGTSSNSASSAQKTVRKYKKGAEVDVFYDPESPTVSVLETGTGWIAYAVAAFCAIFALVGIILIVSPIVKILLFGAAVGYALTKKG